MNYHEELEKIIAINEAEGRIPRLLLHCCCAPCSSRCLEFLNGKLDITCYFFNPNITDETEYLKRLNELKNFVSRAFYGAFPIIDGGFSPSVFYAAAKGMEEEKEGGARCFSCYALRLEKTAEYARENGFDYFGTTLTVSPHKNARKLNQIGFSLENGVKYLPSDFKKQGGYQRSIELSNEYGLYRQNFCGCEFSRNQAGCEGRAI